MSLNSISFFQEHLPSVSFCLFFGCIHEFVWPNRRPDPPVWQQLACTFMQSVTKSAAQGLDSSLTKEVIQCTILVGHHQCKIPSSCYFVQIHSVSKETGLDPDRLKIISCGHVIEDGKCACFIGLQKLLWESPNVYLLKNGTKDRVHCGVKA